VEADELAAAHERIAQLEDGLALTRDACELFNLSLGISIIPVENSAHRPAAR
jgi:hypothetical protein